MKIKKIATVTLLLTVIGVCSAEWTDDSSINFPTDDELVWVQQSTTEENKDQRFPPNMTVWFYLEDVPVYIDLVRDDKMTRYLNPGMMKSSSIFPNDLMTYENKEDFAFYHNDRQLEDPDRVNFVIHRESTDQPGRIYGHFKMGGEVFVISPNGESFNQHRVERYAQTQAKRQKRAVDVSNDNVIEIVCWIAPDALLHFRDLSGFSKKSNKLFKYITDYAEALLRDVDIIFKRSSQVDLRAYLVGVDYFTNDDEDWYLNNLSGDKMIAPAALADFTTFVQTLTSSLFLEFDHVMALTRHNLVEAEGVNEEMISLANFGSMCQGSNSMSLVEISQKHYLKATVQAILTAMGVTYASGGNNLFVMSENLDTVPTENKADNPWRIKNNKQNEIQSLIDGFTTNCLRIQGSSFDFETFYASDSVGQLFSVDEQCALVFGAISTACDNLDTTMCYEGIMCINPDNGLCENRLYVGDRTVCNTNLATPRQCRYGLCEYRPISSSSSTSSSTASPSTSTSTLSPSTSTSSASPSTSTSSASPSTSTSSASPSTSTSSASPSTSTSSASPSTSTSSASPSTSTSSASPSTSTSSASPSTSTSSASPSTSTSSASPSTSTSTASPSTSTSSASPSTSTSTASPSTSTSSASPSTSTSSASPSTSTSSASPSTSTSSSTQSTTPQQMMVSSSMGPSSTEMPQTMPPFQPQCPRQKLGKVTINLEYEPCPMEDGTCPQHMCGKHDRTREWASRYERYPNDIRQRHRRFPKIRL